MSDPDLTSCSLRASFPLTSVAQSDRGAVLLLLLLLLLLRTDNKPLHSSADSSSPKATLIVLKHAAPVKLIIVLAYRHFVAGPLMQRARGFSAEPLFACPLKFHCFLFFFTLFIYVTHFIKTCSLNIRRTRRTLCLFAFLAFVLPVFAHWS